MWRKQTTNLRFLTLRYLVGASGRYARSCLANCVKVLIGRKTFFHDYDLIFQQYVLQLIGLRPIQRLTCVGRSSEGPGSQALFIMHAINFARSSGLIYVHTPFSAILHADRPQQEWANAWETFFNLGVGERVCDVQRHQVVSYGAAKLTGGLYLFFGWENRFDELADHFKALVPEFRHKYYTNKSTRTTEEVTVAVHVRRGWDVSVDGWHYTSTDSILRTITLVKAVLDNHSIEHKISVYSEGNSADFGEICIPGVELSKYRVGHYSFDRVRYYPDAPSTIESVVDIDAISAARELIEADVLIMSEGSLCYCAALISDGIKIYGPPRKPHILKPMMDDWLLRLPDGSFDSAALEHQLSLLLQAKATICKKRQVEGRPQ